MGRRKFRLQLRKNYERKKYLQDPSLKLPLSIPLSLVTVNLTEETDSNNLKSSAFDLYKKIAASKMIHGWEISLVISENRQSFFIVTGSEFC